MLNAQVWVDTIPTDGQIVYEDMGPTFATTADDSVQAAYVGKGGELIVNHYILDSVIVDSGTITFNSQGIASGFYFLPGSTVNGNGQIIGGSTTTAAWNRMKTVFIDSNVVFNSNFGTISFYENNGSCSGFIVNNTEGFSFSKLELRTAQWGHKVDIYGTAAVSVDEVVFDNKRNPSVNLYNKLIVNNKINVADKSMTTTAINLNGDTLVLGENISFVYSDDATITNLNDFRINLSNGGVIGQKLSSSTSYNYSDIGIKMLNGAVTDSLSITANSFTSLGTPVCYFAVVDDKLPNLSTDSYLERYLYYSVDNAAAIDMDIAFNYNKSEVVGTEANIKNAHLDMVGLSWNLGSAVNALDSFISVSNVTTLAGAVTGRSDIDVKLMVVTDTILEINLNGGVADFVLGDALLLDSVILTSNVTLTDAPMGLSVDTVIAFDAISGQVLFTFDSTNFDSDIDLKITIGAAELYPAVDLTDSLLLVPQSNDTLLSDISVDLNPVTGFISTTFEYNVDIAVGADSTVSANANDPNASVVITQASSIPGTATIVVTAEDGYSKATYLVNIDYATGVSVTSSAEISVWPNPSSGIVNIEGASNELIQVIDVLGNVVVNVNASNEIEKLDLSNLKGLYLVKVGNEIQQIVLE
jgi:hypothetical protein